MGYRQIIGHKRSKSATDTPEEQKEIILYGTTTDDFSECWVWQKKTNKAGYGVVNTNGKTWLTHRLSYTVFVGPIPDGLFVCHTCDNPPCCNPKHFFLGTHLENMEDCTNKGRRLKNYSLGTRDRAMEFISQGKADNAIAFALRMPREAVTQIRKKMGVAPMPRGDRFTLEILEF